MHSLEIVQWDSTRRDHLGYPGRVSGSGPVSRPTVMNPYSCVGLAECGILLSPSSVPTRIENPC